MTIAGSIGSSIAAGGLSGIVLFAVLESWSARHFAKKRKSIIAQERLRAAVDAWRAKYGRRYEDEDQAYEA